MFPRSITAKLLALIVVAFTLMSVTVLLVSNEQLTAIIDASQKEIYAKRLDVIWKSLQSAEERLQKTGMVAAYGEGFKRATCAEIASVHYTADRNYVAPFIFDTAGETILHVNGEEGALIDDQSVVRMAAIAEGDFVIRHGGSDHWYIFKQFEPWGWTIAYAMPLEVKYRNAWIFFERLLLALSAVGIAVLIVVAIIVTRFTRPIVILTKVSAQIAEGKLDQHIETGGRDEVGSLARSFASMRDAVKSQLDELQSNQENLEAKVEERTAELKRAQHKLLESAHRAGMAEIATGILHNIGNLLTSVVVSTDILKKRLGGDIAHKLEKVAAMVEANRDNMAHFLTEDAQGKRIVTFFTHLPTYFHAERDKNIAIVEKLEASVDIIAKSVASQQSYANQGAFDQVLSPVEEVELLLGLEAPSLEKHVIDVATDFSFSGTVSINRNIFANAFLNLLRNAKEAVANMEEKRVAITLTRTESGELELCITDTGEGIDPEIIDRIFSYGFTTKEGCFGFGLHQTANTIQLQGGDVKAYSDGRGCGARFVLTLPAERIVSA